MSTFGIFFKETGASGSVPWRHIVPGPHGQFTSVNEAQGLDIKTRLQEEGDTKISFEANLSFFLLAESPPRDLYITAYKYWSAHAQSRPNVFGLVFGCK